MAVKGKGKQIAGNVPASSTSSSGKRKNPRSDGESSGARPKKKRSGVLQFVDDVAGDADFEGKEEDDDLEWGNSDDIDFELPDSGAKGVKNAAKGPGKSSPLPFFIKEEEMDDDELEEAIKERYRGSGFVSFDEDVKECDKSELVAHTTKHLSVWRVKCMIGRERQAAFCLMQKFVDLQKIGKKLLIFSVFVLDHIKGFVYIEADKACNVFEACNGLCILYPSRVDLVPRNEAPNLLSIQKKECGISKGMWVRMKNGKYKGDLAEAVFVNDAKKVVTVKLVPRIDLQAIAKKFGGGISLKAASIPAPRLISSHELEDFRPHIEIKHDSETGEFFEVLDGLTLKDGYLYKKASMVSLIHWGVQPSSAELTKFEDTSKDEIKDVSWLSSIYKARMKKKLPETSKPKDGNESNPKDENKQRHGFDIDDLVLFGKKGCGIVVDKENDTFKVLKGDVNGSEVVAINIREIKKICVDKVFTATDRYMKTISIDDVVKVSEGLLEGREGIVRHMYKGILFIYDECQSENSGFFCAKAEICDLVKKSRNFGGGKSGSKADPSFAQPSIRSSEQEDNSRSFSRDRKNNSRGTFSVGQTLRICKGPLKGYLCRVIRIYRADITVKLDSLGKLLTVDEKLLSFQNSKRDDVTATQCDMFGSQEEQSIGGILDVGRGLGTDNSELNAGMPSFGSDSWNAPSSSSFSFPRDNSKDQNQGDDPWGSKLSSSLNGDPEQGAANRWGKEPNPSAEQNSWNKMENVEKAADTNCKNDADPWGKASSKGETSTGGWKNDNPSQKTDQAWSTKGAKDGLDRAVNTVVDSVSDASGWSKAKPDSECQTFGEDGWNKAASTVPTISNTATGGWERTKLPSSDVGGSWNTKNDADPSDKASSKGETSTVGWKNDNPSQKTGQTWSMKGARDGLDRVVNTVVDSVNDVSGWSKATLSTPDPECQTFGEGGWSKAASTVPTISNTETGGWEKTKLPSSEAGGSWNTKGADWNKESSGKDKAESFGGQSGNWASPKIIDGDNRDSLDVKGKVLLRNSNDNWGQSAGSQEKKPAASSPWESSLNSAVQNKTWKTASTEDRQAANWGAATQSLDSASQTNSWGTVKTVPSPIELKNSEQAGAIERGGWKKATEGNQAAGWAASAIHSTTSSVEAVSQSNSWDKSIPSSSGWEKSNTTDTETVVGWKTTTNDNQAAGWSSSAMHLATPSVKPEKQTSNWGEVSNSPSLIDGWNKEKSSDTDHTSGWNKAVSAEGGKDASTDSWDKPKNSEGHGFGQESQKDGKVGSDWSKSHHDPNVGKPNDSDWGQGSDWSKEKSNDENGKNWGQGNSWNQKRDFDGGRGSSWGRGRGRYGGRGDRNEDNSDGGQGSGWSKEKSNDENGKNWGQSNSLNQNRDSDGGRGSSWGRGRGRYGGRGDRNEDNSDGGQGSGWSNEKSNDENGKNWGQGNSWTQNMDSDGGRGFTRGRGRGRYGGRGNRNEDNSDGGQGSGWSKENFNNENGNNWGQGNSLNQNRDSDGGRGFTRGRGRGRYGGRGDRNEDSTDGGQGSGWSKENSNNENARNWGQGNSWSQNRDSDGGRGSTRGRGRGRYGGRGDRNEDNSDGGRGQGSGWSKEISSDENGSNWSQGNSWSQNRSFDGGRGSTRGRGRGRYGGRGDRNEDNTDGGQGSGWSKENSNNENGMNWGQGSSWNQNRDFNGGRGRGRSGGRGDSEKSDGFQGSGWSNENSNNTENDKNWGQGSSWNQKRDFDGGGGSTMGTGRGDGNEDNVEKTGDSNVGKQDSWCATPSVPINKSVSGKSSWDSPKDGAGGGWTSMKKDGSSSSGQKDDPWGSASATTKLGQDSSWN